MNGSTTLRSSAISLALVSCIHNSGPRDDALSLSSGKVTVSGTVTDSDGSPIPGATIAIHGADASATTDADGRYTLSNVPAGPSSVVVSREGYATVRTSGKFSTKKSDSDRNRVDVNMLTPDQVAVLSTRQVHDSVILDRNGFLDRESSVRDAYFITPEQIDQIRPRTISDIFRHVPFVMESNGPGSSLLRSGRTCFVTYVDGLVRRVAAPSDLESFVSPLNVIAAEVYPPGELPPAAFSHATSRPSCTTVALWTRS